MCVDVVNLTQEFDARAWAKEWLRIIAEHPDVPTDEGTMIGWFANALMAGYDYAHRPRPAQAGTDSVSNQQTSPPPAPLPTTVEYRCFMSVNDARPPNHALLVATAEMMLSNLRTVVMEDLDARERAFREDPVSV